MVALENSWGNKQESLISTQQATISTWITLLIVIQSIVIVLPLWLTWHFPNQNGLLYMLAIHVLKDFNNPIYNFAQFHNKFFLVVPNLTFHSLVYFLSFFFPLTIAYKVMVTINMVLVPVALFYFIKAIKPENLLYGFVGYVYSYSYFLLKGYDTFIISFIFFLFYFLNFYRWLHSGRIKSLLMMLLFCTLIYLSHIYTFLMAFFVSLIFLFIKEFSAQKIKKVLYVFLPGFLLFARYLYFVYNQPVESFGGNPYKFFKLHWIISDFFQMDMYSYSMVFVFLFWAGYGYIFFPFIKDLFQKLKQFLTLSTPLKVKIKQFAREHPFHLLWVLLCVFYFLSPREILGWGKFNIRVLPFMLFFSLVAAPALKSVRLQKLFLLTVFVASIIASVVLHQEIRKINTELNEYLSGIPYIENGKRLLPIHLEDYKVGKIRPLNWAYNFYTLEKGGTTWRCAIFGFPGRVPVHYNQPIRMNEKGRIGALHPKKPEDIDEEYILDQYDYMLIWGNNEKVIAALEKLASEQLFINGKLRIYKLKSKPRG
ncbi:MAG: hypothetical protein D6748_14845 [Calditrichaeota bacterium]|nr:MAG: hypothetical protein D6748_14845 [Calditrichota bacterium]